MKSEAKNMGSWCIEEGSCDYCGNLGIIYTAFKSKICSRCAFVIGRHYVEELENLLMEMKKRAK